MSRPDPTAAKLIAANAENCYSVHMADLPLSCPMPGMHLWNSHPRVYLPIEANGKARCPYCGAVYVLEGHGLEGHGPEGHGPEGHYPHAA